MNVGNSFRENLEIGQLGESIIARWLKDRGRSVLPVYEKQIDTGKGPRFFTPRGKFAAPDMFVFPLMRWVEAKHKSRFTWYRIRKSWQTGIDLNHYRDYLQIEAISQYPIWLFFLHKTNIPSIADLNSGSPKTCPAGLFIQKLQVLKECVDHTDKGDKNNSRHGMVYWNHKDLKLEATLDEMETYLIGDPDFKVSPFKCPEQLDLFI